MTDVISATVISLMVSLSAIGVALPIAASVVIWLLHTRRRQLARWVHDICQLFCALPAVVAGLVVYLLLMTDGPFGNLGWLFTKKAIILGQLLICLPILIIGIHNAIARDWRLVWETALTLSGSPLRALVVGGHEFRFHLLNATLMAFGRIVAEIGSAVIVGGNILYHTRTLSTAITLEVSRGDYWRGIQLGIVLLCLALAVQLLLMRWRGRFR